MQRIPEIDAAEAMAMLSKRWEQRRSVREAFLSVDKDCDGVISPSELRASVDALGVKLSGPEFRCAAALRPFCPAALWAAHGRGLFLRRKRLTPHLSLLPHRTSPWQEAVAHAGRRGRGQAHARCL